MLGGEDNDSSSNSRTAISVLVLLRLLPYTLLSSLGGVLADSHDRRHCMIVLDLVGAVTVWLHVVAIWVQSLQLLYVAALLQTSVGALYEPCKSSLVPLLVTSSELKKATTLSGLAWSLMAAVGSSLGGIAVARLGVQQCFAIDSASYIASAIIMYQVGGSWTVSKPTNADQPPGVMHMIVEGTRYLVSNTFGPFCLLKTCAALVFGAFDVINVVFSEQNVADKAAAVRLGYLFGCVGVGCVLGPLIADLFTSLNYHETLLLACCYSMVTITIGAIGMGWIVTPFLFSCIFTAIRAAGSSILWIDSSLLLHKFCAPEMLGRVMAVDFALATLSEAASTYMCGVLLDQLHLSGPKVCYVMAVLGAILSASWFIYYHTQWAGSVVRPASSHEDRLPLIVRSQRTNEP